MATLLIVGGGKMGSALLMGLLDGRVVTPGDCTIVEIDAAARTALEQRFPDVSVVAAPVASESVILAIKPADLDAACGAVRAVGAKRVLSIVAGAPIARLQGLLGDGVAVVRAMPNTPALLGCGASAFAGGSSAGEPDLAWAERVLGAVGVAVRLPEKLLDAVTGLSGSGPAYVFLVAEAMIDAGVLVGLDRTTARLLAVQTLLGASRMLEETGQSADELRGAVTSPGGTTAAGLHVLEQRGVRAAILDAVVAATERSRSLGA